jgi:hypothetical protein
MNSNRLTVQKHQIMVLRIKLISTKERGVLHAQVDTEAV